MLLLAFLTLITIEGHVLDAVTQQPVAEARVVLLRDGQNYTSSIWTTPVTESPAAGAPVLSVRTNNLGIFRFEIEGPVKFRLFVSKDGYVRNMNNRFDLTGGRKDLDIRLMPQATISGRVVDVETQQPVQGFTVVAHSDRGAGGERVLIFAGSPGKTDEEGRYRIEQLPPGEYFVELAPSLGATFQKPKPVEDFAADVRLEYGLSWYPGVRTDAEAVPVHVSAGAAVDGIDFKLAKRPMPALRGVVSETSAADEVQLMLYSVKRDVASAAYRMIASGATKPGESFELANLAPGEYYLYATGPGTPAERHMGGRSIHVDERNVDLGEIVIERGLDVAGRVLVEDAREAPALAGMVVELRPPTRMGLFEEPAPVDPATGRFVLRNILPEAYEVLPGRAPKGFAAREARYNGTPLVHGLLQLDAAAVRQELELVLAPANSAIQVTVTDGARPLAKATVLLVQEPVTAEVLRRLPRRYTDNEGRITIQPLLPGKYRVAAFPAGAAWANDPLLGQRLSSAQEVNVAPNATATIQIRAVMQ